MNDNYYFTARNTVDADFAVYAESFEAALSGLPTHRPTIGCVIPAYNEADSIASVLDSLLMQTRLPDVIHVVVNNSTADTATVASNYAGLHFRQIDQAPLSTVIFVHDIGENPAKKDGGLN